MNKKEFDERFGWLKTNSIIKYSDIWQWIEQQLKDARIDELEKLKQADRTIGLLINYEATYLYIENRIKELNEKKS